MKIAVIGAGISGVCTAYELARDCHDVTVFECKQSVAEVASFGNAGVMSPALTHPVLSNWLYNGLWACLPGYGPSLHLSKIFSWQHLTWLSSRTGHELAESSSKNYLKWKSLLDLARLSAEHFEVIYSDLQLSFDGQKGQLVLLRSESEQKAIQAALEQFKTESLDFRLLNAEYTRHIEPALGSDTPLFGSVLLPQDQVANCRQVAQLLKQHCEKLLVRWSFQDGVQSIHSRPEGVHLQLRAGHAETFQAVVVCSGSSTLSLLKSLGLSCPIEPIMGYSISGPLRESLHAPRSAIWDYKNQVHISRLGQRIRVSGCYALNDTQDTPNTADLKPLYRALEEWFPGAAMIDQSAQIWKGARPTLIDGLPVLGHSGLPGVWLNFGHGNLGWTLAFGAANTVARQISERHVALQMDHFSIGRF
jgi:D-amino-acid dehydrogenase